ncbi:hypothetical protein M0802_012738 [Mischocyttarus mexicanus]|nr:hypothetical protein M0802_012738 [Mischocyttarus mexicanus]
MDLATAEETRDLIKTTLLRLDVENKRILSLCREMAMDHQYFKTGRYEATMQIYLGGVSLLNKRLNELSSRTSQARPPAQSRFRTSLLNIALPNFSGAFSE